MDIRKIDSNFADAKPTEDGFIYYNVKNAPFSLEGLPFYAENSGAYYRLPLTITENEVNKGAIELGWHTSGVHVRFRSDSPEIMLRAKLHKSCDSNHMPRTGSAGFDSYFKAPGKKMLYNATVKPDPGTVDICQLCGVNDTGKVCDWIINLPLYGGVTELEIGIKENFRLLAPKAHKVEKPILFYGSSITQGGCASRPGNNYTAMLCRAVDAPEINWGFSGSGRGEPGIAELISNLDLAAFVMDYDHNAPNTEHLQNTHEQFFRIVRSKNPELPIILVSRCDFHNIRQAQVENNYLRRDIIYKTYTNAVESGDKNVWFVDGEKLFGSDLYDSCTVDGVHPNDLGFYRIYRGVLPTLKKALRAALLPKR
ncbi:MAG: hypothetical protein IKC77_01975 [Lentisphaeria bacterium]|nr:hypothetical protein [Lentisphaeria bacterium]